MTTHLRCDDQLSHLWQWDTSPVMTSHHTCDDESSQVWWWVISPVITSYLTCGIEIPHLWWRVISGVMMSYLTCNNKLSHLLPTWMLRAFSSSSRSFCSLSASLRCCSSGSTSLNRPSFMFSLNARSDSVPHIIFTFISSHRCHKVPTIRQPGFDLPRQQWSLLNRFRKEQGHCGVCRRKWRLTDTDLCPCGETQTMSHIVESCPLTKLNCGLSRLHSADEDAASWLTNYGPWHAYEKKKKCYNSTAMTQTTSRMTRPAPYCKVLPPGAS